MKKLISLFLVLALMLTMAGTMGAITVSAEETDVVTKVYIEDFENVTVADDGTISTGSGNSFVSMTFPKTFTTNSKTSGSTIVEDSLNAITYDSIICPNTYSMWRNNGGNFQGEVKATFTTESKALFMKDGYYPNGEYSFSIEPVTTGTVKVSYDVYAVESRRGNSLTGSGGLMGLYDTSTNKVIATISDYTYGEVNKKYDGGGGVIATDGTTQVKLTNNKRGSWINVQYFVDIDNELYTIIFDGVTYGPFAFANSIAQIDKIICGKPQQYGQHIIDNVRVETRSKAKATDLIGADGETVIGTAPLSSISDKTAPVAPAVDGKKFMGWYAEDMATPVTFATYTGTKAYAKYVDIVLREDFENAVIDYETGKITSTGFDITLGNGTTLPNKDRLKIEKGVGSDGGAALYVSRAASKGEMMAYAFPAIKTGKIKVSFDYKIKEFTNRDGSTGDNSFGSLISGNAASKSNAVCLYECGWTGSKYLREFYTYDTEIKTDKEVMLGGTQNEWQHMEYYADLDKKEYVILHKNNIFGPYHFTADVLEVNALYFSSLSRAESWGGKYYIDNIVVDTDYQPNIVDNLTGEVDAKGEVMALGSDEILTIAADATLKNATINATRGMVKVGATEITGGTMTFDENGKIDALIGSTLKFHSADYTYTLKDPVTGKDTIYDSKNSSTAQGFVSKQENKTGKYVMTLTAANGEDTRTKELEFDLTNNIYEGPLRFIAVCVGVPEGYSITQKAEWKE